MRLKLIAALAIFLAVGRGRLRPPPRRIPPGHPPLRRKGPRHASMRLIPGVAVSAAILARIDTDGDGILSAQEQRAYADRTLHDLTLTLDGHRLQPKLLSITCPQIEQIREGLGEIQLEFTAGLPPGGPTRRLTFESPNQGPSAAYLVNALVPKDPAIHIVTQTRNVYQSLYQLDYTQPSPSPEPSTAPHGSSQPHYFSTPSPAGSSSELI